MNKLLLANFARLFRNRVFWLCMAGMAGIGALAVIMQYRDSLEYGLDPMLDNMFFGHALLIGVFCAVFCGLFLGTEYSDGTIRNKLVIGHGRNAIYFSNLITVIVAALLMCAAYIAVVSAIGIPLMGFVQCEPRLVVFMLLGCMVMTVAFGSLYTMLGMLNQNKAAASVTAVIGAFLLLMAAAAISSRLDAPEFYDGYVLSGDTGEVATEKVPNSAYLRGEERAVYEFLLDFLPSGQGIQYSSMTAAHLWQMPLYSLLVSAASTGVGVLAFRRKDLK